MFKGGLSDTSDQTIKYHTACHLLLAALQQEISPDIEQKGSNLTPERLRFDFNVDHKLTPDELQRVEDKVNAWIAANLPVTFAEYDKDYAFDTLHAHGSFRDRYPDRVTVYTVGDPAHPTSIEICGGPHVTHTGALGHFKIQKEESSSKSKRKNPLPPASAASKPPLPPTSPAARLASKPRRQTPSLAQTAHPLAKYAIIFSWI